MAASTIRKTFRYRIYPTVAQRDMLDGHLRLCCELYNAAIQERRDAWRTARVAVRWKEQAAQLRAVKSSRHDVAGVHAQVLQNVLRRVERRYDAFFRRRHMGERAGYPRFRAEHRYDSMTYPQHGYSVDGRRLRVSKIGTVKIKLHRPIEGMIKTLTVKREVGKWFACFSVIVQPTLLPTSGESVGIDLGLTHFATLSDGTKIANPRHARKAQAQRRRAQRRFRRRRRDGAGQREAVRLIQVIQTRVRRQRADVQHKLSRRLVDRYGFIAVEHLNMKGLTSSRLAKSIYDASWSSFIEKLAYKAESAGRVLVKVDPRGTSQTCLCGASVPKTLEERWHLCPSCGLSLARDHVSAQLILSRGLRDQSITWAPTPCVL